MKSKSSEEAIAQLLRTQPAHCKVIPHRHRSSTSKHEPKQISIKDTQFWGCIVPKQYQVIAARKLAKPSPNPNSINPRASNSALLLNRYKRRKQWQSNKIGAIKMSLGMDRKDGHKNMRPHSAITWKNESTSVYQSRGCESDREKYLSQTHESRLLKMLELNEVIQRRYEVAHRIQMDVMGIKNRQIWVH